MAPGRNATSQCSRGSRTLSRSPCFRDTLYRTTCRCRLLDTWWASPAASNIRNARVRALASAMTKRQTKCLRKRKPSATSPTSGTRRSSRPHQPRLFSHPVVNFSEPLAWEHEVGRDRLHALVPVRAITTWLTSSLLILLTTYYFLLIYLLYLTY